VILGALHDKGDGVKQNKVKAVELYTQAHAAGSIIATLNLGVMYFKGEGVKQNKAKAFEFFGKAHSAGDVEATFKLAGMYAMGDYVEQNMIIAVKLLQQAQAAGHTESAIMLRKVFAKTQAVPEERQVPVPTNTPQRGVAFALGDAVVLAGLTKKPELNGCRGVVLNAAVPNQPGRVGVEVDGKMIAVPLEKLEHVA